MWQVTAPPQMEVERLVGGFAETVAASKLVKPEGLALLAEKKVLVWPGKAWAFAGDVEKEAEAKALAKKVQRLLIGKRDLDEEVPKVHNTTLYVFYQGGFTFVPGVR
jgi:hypothetical protein